MDDNQAPNLLEAVSTESLKDQADALKQRIEARQQDQWRDRGELGRINVELRRREAALAEPDPEAHGP